MYVTNNKKLKIDLLPYNYSTKINKTGSDIIKGGSNDFAGIVSFNGKLNTRYFLVPLEAYRKVETSYFKNKHYLSTLKNGNKILHYLENNYAGYEAKEVKDTKPKQLEFDFDQKKDDFEAEKDRYKKLSEQEKKKEAEESKIFFDQLKRSLSVQS
jgi:hypothetical protein